MFYGHVIQLVAGWLCSVLKTLSVNEVNERGNSVQEPVPFKKWVVTVELYDLICLTSRASMSINPFHET